MSLLYFEDIPLHQPTKTTEYLVTEGELVSFAREWDPEPIHTDVQAAQASPHGGLIASAVYTIAVSTRMGKSTGAKMALVGGAEWKVRFPTPIRPGDRLVETIECIDKRASKTKPDRGIARFLTIMRNQKGETVMEFECPTIILRRGSP